MKSNDRPNRFSTLFFDENGHLKKSFAAVFLLPVTLLILIQAYSGKFDWSPDEYDHYAAAQVFTERWVPPPVGDDAILFTYSRYGYSYFDNYEICYLAAGVMLRVGDVLGIPPFFTIRTFNAILWLGIVIVVLGVPRLRLLSLFLAVTPKVWFLFTYFNADAFSMVLVIGLVVLLTGCGFFRIKKQLLFWTFIVLLTFSKFNYLIFVGFALCVGASQWYVQNNLDWKKLGLAIFSVGAVLISLLGLRVGLDYALTGPNKMQQRLAVIEDLATPAFHPENIGQSGANTNLRMRQQGVTLYEIIFEDEWGLKLLRDAAGVFGNHFFYFCPQINPILVVLLPSLFIIWLMTSCLGMDPKTRVLLALAIMCLAANLAAALYYTWVIDFQAQLRYLLPGILCLILVMLPNQNNTSRMAVVPLALMAYLLAWTTFAICVLFAMPRSEQFNVGRDPLYFKFGDEAFWEKEEDFYNKRKTHPTNYP